MVTHGWSSCEGPRKPKHGRRSASRGGQSARMARPLCFPAAEFKPLKDLWHHCKPRSMSISSSVYRYVNHSHQIRKLVGLRPELKKKVETRLVSSSERSNPHISSLLQIACGSKFSLYPCHAFMNLYMCVCLNRVYKHENSK